MFVCQFIVPNLIMCLTLISRDNLLRLTTLDVHEIGFFFLQNKFPITKPHSKNKSESLPLNQCPEIQITLISSSAQTCSNLSNLLPHTLDICLQYIECGQAETAESGVQPKFRVKFQTQQI